LPIRSQSREIDAGHLAALADHGLQPGMDRLEVARVEATQGRREMALDRCLDAVGEEPAGHSEAAQAVLGLDLAQDAQAVARRPPDQGQGRRKPVHADADVGDLHGTGR
jgi:hypothetical protein